ncbi:MAG: Aldose 1-epimerase precursor [Bacteroidetes bacterium ADurb.BinA261]|jgi:aldose 1-epimerase|nr:MAG: Aldose 1-epimerase precursor [Bacteroidetes bacterium ADurb.BinA261]
MFIPKRESRSGLLQEAFAKNVDGKQTGLYVLTNSNGCELAITNYGAKIVALIVPDRSGNFVDVVTGHDSIDDYLTSEEPYFGAVCGRTANRIAKGKFTLDGKEYTLAINNGPNNLHGGIKGFNAVVWDVLDIENSRIRLHYLSPDGEEGFPGNLSVTVTYTLTDENAVEIDYRAETDQATILNLTNHSYFNLSGAGDPTIGDHLLRLMADTYLPTDETAIPYGKPEPVRGTPMDFTEVHTIGERINDDFQQLVFGNGYDHNFILNKQHPDDYVYAGMLQSPKTGIVMEMYTSQPGVQMYTGNWMTGNLVGKKGQRYPARSAVCFETQHYPDSIHHPEYPSIILRPGDIFESKTTYKFLVK